MQRRVWFSIFLVVGFMVGVLPVRAQDAKDKPAAPPDAAAKKDEKKAEAPRHDAEEWMKMGAPGEHHKHLEPLVGKWNLVVKFPPETEGGAWSETPGKAEFRWAMGGRFLIEEVKSQIQGQPFEWMCLHGYDNQKKKHVSAWIDNLGTEIDQMDGTCGDGGKSLVYTAQVEEAHVGKFSIKWSMKLEAQDKLFIEMFSTPQGGKEDKVMQVVGTRAASEVRP